VRHHQASFRGRSGASAQTSPTVGAPRPAPLQCRSSNRPCTPELRENARGVCVARWYDPNTGEFLSVDPDFNETLDAYGYADENPVYNTDLSGFYNTADDSIECEFDPTACNPTTSGCSVSYTHAMKNYVHLHYVLRKLSTPGNVDNGSEPSRRVPPA